MSAKLQRQAHHVISDAYPDHSSLSAAHFEGLIKDRHFNNFCFIYTLRFAMGLGHRPKSQAASYTNLQRSFDQVDRCCTSSNMTYHHHVTCSVVPIFCSICSKVHGHFDPRHILLIGVRFAPAKVWKKIHRKPSFDNTTWNVSRSCHNRYGELPTHYALDTMSMNTQGNHNI